MTSNICMTLRIRDKKTNKLNYKSNMIRNGSALDCIYENIYDNGKHSVTNIYHRINCENVLL